MLMCRNPFANTKKKTVAVWVKPPVQMPMEEAFDA
jgi:hypothetical protein